MSACSTLLCLQQGTLHQPLVLPNILTHCKSVPCLGSCSMADLASLHRVPHRKICSMHAAQQSSAGCLRQGLAAKGCDCSAIPVLLMIWEQAQQQCGLDDPSCCCHIGCHAEAVTPWP